MKGTSVWMTVFRACSIQPCRVDLWPTRSIVPKPRTNFRLKAGARLVPCDDDLRPRPVSGAVTPQRCSHLWRYPSAWQRHRFLFRRLRRKRVGLGKAVAAMGKAAGPTAHGPRSIRVAVFRPAKPVGSLLPTAVVNDSAISGRGGLRLHSGRSSDAPTGQAVGGGRPNTGPFHSPADRSLPRLERLKQLRFSGRRCPTVSASACATVDRTIMRRPSFSGKQGGATTVWAVLRRGGARVR
jgi:hypothetical protein